MIAISDSAQTSGSAAHARARSYSARYALESLALRFTVAGDVVSLVLWGVAGVAIASRRFHWEPQGRANS